MLVHRPLAIEGTIDGHREILAETGGRPGPSWHPGEVNARRCSIPEVSQLRMYHDRAAAGPVWVRPVACLPWLIGEIQAC